MSRIYQFLPAWEKSTFTFVDAMIPDSDSLLSISNVQCPIKLAVATESEVGLDKVLEVVVNVI